MNDGSFSVTLPGGEGGIGFDDLFYDAGMNGKPGDHPIDDIVHYGTPTFTPEIDALVKEVHALGGFENTLAANFLLPMQERLWSLGRSGEASTPERQAQSRETLLRNLKFVLAHERDRLQSRKGQTG